MKTVSAFNDDFKGMILGIPNISVDETIDRYPRGLKESIWKELCTREYENLTDAMRDTERVEAARGRVSTFLGEKFRKSYDTVQKPVPMEIGNTQLKNLTPEERE